MDANDSLAAEYLDTVQAAELMGMRPQTLHNWRFRGVGPAYTAISGRAIRYHIDDLRKFMQARRVVPHQEVER